MEYFRIEKSRQGGEIAEPNAGHPGADRVLAGAHRGHDHVLHGHQFRSGCQRAFAPEHCKYYRIEIFLSLQ